MSASADHIPARLWWVLAGLTLAWGFNWTAIKLAVTEVAPFTFRSMCLGVGSAILFAAMKAGGHSLAVPKGQWGRLIGIGLIAAGTGSSWWEPVEEFLTGYALTRLPELYLPYWPPVPFLPLFIIAAGAFLATKSRA